MQNQRNILPLFVDVLVYVTWSPFPLIICALVDAAYAVSVLQCSLISSCCTPLFLSFFSGDVINLGDRQLTVLHMPGHSRGSICLHDKDNKILFSGDVVYDGSMIDWLPYSAVGDYVHSCQRLVEMVDKEEVEQVMPGHYNAFGAKRLHRLASTYISSVGTCHRLTTCAVKSVAGLVLRASNSCCACY